MRPIKLIMHNFGPFIDETLDFTQLDAAIFLISGPTGSGKTTIFDAMCYALYGEASSSDRMVRGLKSDFAAPGAVAQVIFTFALGTQTYRIERTPEQQRKSLRGDRLVSQKHEVNLYTLLPEGDKLLESDVKNADTRIQQIMGINATQFRQIIMLPQGQFSQLLKASAKERQDLLKSIFHPGEYKGLADGVERHLSQAKENAKGIAAQIHQEQQHLRPTEDSPLAQALANPNDTTEEHLTACITQQIEADTAKATALSASIETEQNQLNDRIAAIATGEATNARFDAWEEAKDDRKNQEDAAKGIEKDRNRLAQGRTALGFSSLERRCTEADEACKTARSRLEDEKTAIDTLTTKVAELDTQCTTMASEHYTKKIEAARTKGQGLERLAQGLTDYADLRHEQQALVRQCTNATKAMEARKAQQAELDEIAEKLKKAADAKGDLTDALQQNLEDGSAAASHLGILNTLSDDIAKRQEHRALLRSNEADRLLCLRESKQYEAEMNRIQRVREASAAWELAQTLAKDTPCPVCGSTHHPNPAAKMADLATAEDLKKATDAYNDCQGRLEGIKATNALHTQQALDAHNRITKLREDNGLSSTLDNAEAIAAAITEANDKVTALRQSYKKINQSIKTCDTTIKKLEGKQTTLRQNMPDDTALTTAYDNAKQAQDKGQGALDSTWKNLANSAETLGVTIDPSHGPDHITAIQNEADMARRQADTLSSAIDTARQAYQDAEGELERHQGIQAELSNSLITLRQRRNDAEAELTQALSDAGLTTLQYEAYKTQGTDQLDALEARITEYDQAVATTKNQLRQFAKELSNKTRVDIAALITQKDALHEGLEQKRQAHTAANARITDNTEQAKKLADLAQAQVDCHHQLELLTDLHQTIRGTVAGRPKINLENYILSAYLSDILSCANTFLEASSNSRYHLLVAESPESASSTGLEIEVDDAYTGKRRSAASLSGGETFVAALSMALGLSEMIQSGSGGISFDTLFIDEGFATLDKDALDKAMNCLTRIRTSGRTVGIISHVDDLKERVDARVSIIKSEMGSHLHIENTQGGTHV